MNFFLRSPFRSFLIRGSIATGCIAMALLAGCGGDVVAADKNLAEDDVGGVGGQGGFGGAGGQGGEQSGEQSGGVFIDCAAACAPSVDGGCFESAACEKKCAGYNGSWLSDAADAFVQCAQQDPLCFETPEQCIWRTLYPAAVMATIEVHVTGLATFEGTTLYGHVSPSQKGARPASATIENGSASLLLPFDGQLNSLPITRVFIDKNSDGLCGAGDASASAFVQVSPPFEAPRLEAAMGLADFEQNDPNCSAF